MLQRERTLHRLSFDNEPNTVPLLGAHAVLSDEVELPECPVDLAGDERREFDLLVTQMRSLPVTVADSSLIAKLARANVNARKWHSRSEGSDDPIESLRFSRNSRDWTNVANTCHSQLRMTVSARHKADVENTKKKKLTDTELREQAFEQACRELEHFDIGFDRDELRKRYGL